MNVMLPRKAMLGWLAGLVLATLALPAAAANIYKYIDKDGRTVFNSFIPAEYVKNGYTILNEQGQVVQVVPRAATAEELNAQQAAKAAEDAALAARLAQEEADKLLIRLYRTPEDIERKRDNNIKQLQTQQDPVSLNLTKTEAEIKAAQTAIDNTNKLGRPITDDMKKRLDEANADKATYQAQFDKFEADKTKVVTDAARDIKRLRELMGLPPLEETAPAAAAPAEQSSAEQPAAQ